MRGMLTRDFIPRAESLELQNTNSQVRLKPLDVEIDAGLIEVYDKT